MNINLNELELNNVAIWPLPVKVISVFLVAVSIVFAGYWFDTKSKLAELDTVQAQESELKNTFESKQHKAANLEAYIAQMKTMKESFGALLRQLPEKTEVPGLVEDISHQGLATGLSFRSIRLQPEEAIEFYVELPIEISVEGTYHQFAEFVSNVASLPRIVTLHDFVIRRGSSSSNESKLIMDITAKTYRYTAESEVQ